MKQRYADVRGPLELVQEVAPKPFVASGFKQSSGRLWAVVRVEGKAASTIHSWAQAVSENTATVAVSFQASGSFWSYSVFESGKQLLERVIDDEGRSVIRGDRQTAARLLAVDEHQLTPRPGVDATGFATELGLDVSNREESFTVPCLEYREREPSDVWGKRAMQLADSAEVEERVQRSEPNLPVRRRKTIARAAAPAARAAPVSAAASRPAARIPAVDRGVLFFRVTDLFLLMSATLGVFALVWCAMHYRRLDPRKPAQGWLRGIFVPFTTMPLVRRLAARHRVRFGKPWHAGPILAGIATFFMLLYLVPIEHLIPSSWPIWSALAMRATLGYVVFIPLAFIQQTANRIHRGR